MCVSVRASIQMISLCLDTFGCQLIAKEFNAYDVKQINFSWVVVYLNLKSLQEKIYLVHVLLFPLKNQGNFYLQKQTEPDFCLRFDPSTNNSQILEAF